MGEPNIQFNHLDELFNMAMPNLAFDDVYGGVIVRPGAVGLLIGIECSRIRDSSWMYLLL